MKIENESFLQIASDIKSVVREAVEDVAEELIVDITNNLRNGLKPDGSPQPQNAEATLRSKERRGVPLVSGVNTGTLSDPSKWSIVATGHGLEIVPPRERDDIIQILDAKDYEFVGLPAGGDEKIENAIRSRLERLR